MNEKITSKTVVNFDQIPKSSGLSKEEKARLDGLTDEDIARAAASDPDNPILTAAKLEEFAPIRSPKPRST